MLSEAYASDGRDDEERPTQGAMMRRKKRYNPYSRYERKRNRRNRLTRHHNRPKSLGGTFDNWNIFLLSEEHHRAYHKLFGLRTFREAAEVLMRMESMHNGTD
jgi:hypothetical protein